ncbi:signal peptidase I [Thalassotalea crassostreae]|uniref:signal peptidase I n=1 Tax=Thalassotalea crassostreae TaxID=1763536 RepID=UPI000837BC93|nr:signal peptidase I [Thalassotalea crassostreae]
MATYFSIILVVVTFVTGIVYFIDKFKWAPVRRANLEATQAQCSQPLEQNAIEKIMTPSAAVDTAVQIFPVIAFVLILRSFLWEPFQIPSGSMMPTLYDGDFILVNKFNYGLREPVARNKFWENGSPERGDVVVFKYPENPQQDYIKRVVGLPGDRITYHNKTLYIQPACIDTKETCPKRQQILTKFEVLGEDTSRGMPLTKYTADMLGKKHPILINQQQYSQSNRFFKQPGMTNGEWLVPEGQYMMMGDNRDSSLDSRFWGFVPEDHLVGEAVAIWMSFEFERDEQSFLPKWVPTGIRFNRIGGIH